MEGLEFKVIYVHTIRKAVHMIVEQSEAVEFELTSQSYLGDIPLKPMVSIPRLTNEARESGLRSFIFYPATKMGLDDIKIGEFLTLTGHKLV